MSISFVLHGKLNLHVKLILLSHCDTKRLHEQQVIICIIIINFLLPGGHE